MSRRLLVVEDNSARQWSLPPGREAPKLPATTLPQTDRWIILDGAIMICQMLDVIEKLLTLQDRDQRLRSFQTEITHLA